VGLRFISLEIRLNDDHYTLTAYTGFIDELNEPILAMVVYPIL